MLWIHEYNPLKTPASLILQIVKFNAMVKNVNVTKGNQLSLHENEILNVNKLSEVSVNQQNITLDATHG